MTTPAEQASERNAEDDIALSRLWPFARAAVPYWIARAERAEAAIRKHHDRHADDLCWMDDNELYAAIGLPPREPTVGDPAAMLANCQRYIAQRCKPGGDWKSYAELEARLAECERERDQARRDCDDLHNELGRLHGHVFSKRDYHAMLARIENTQERAVKAEAEVRELREEITRLRAALESKKESMDARNLHDPAR
jgi:hypothetical protein